jgi:hypothetical protein
VFEDEADPRLPLSDADIVVQTSGNLERPAQRQPVCVRDRDARFADEVLERYLLRLTVDGEPLRDRTGGTK